MFSTEETRPAQRIPDAYLGVAAAQQEPDIVRAARMFDEAQRELLHLKQERGKIEESIHQAQGRMNEAASHMRSIIGAVFPEEAPIPRKY